MNNSIDYITSDPIRSVARGERAMWLSVIIAAGKDIIEADTTAKAHRVLNWFYDTATSPGSFVWICQSLELDVSYWRARARSLYFRRVRNGRVMLYGA